MIGKLRSNVQFYSILKHEFHPVCAPLNVTPASTIFVAIFSRVLRDSTPRFVGPSVRRSVRHTLLFRGVLRLWASLLLLK